MKTTVIHRPVLRRITAKSKSFLEGNHEAMGSIESYLDSLRGRKFYGLFYESDDQKVYHTAPVLINEAEECRFAELGFPIMKVKGGACARAKLLDWSSRIDQIGITFGTMINNRGIDTSNTCGLKEGQSSSAPSEAR
ncbi:hypothetical protein OAN94_00465 [Verrucomicrobiales bacterium]|jgi:hypothetical protein|nr:hypothetical protein [Verrucomicrobiales bacterium]MDF1788067.1 hypothetical protein [Verrucomicrobiales bacterium]